MLEAVTVPEIKGGEERGFSDVEQRGSCWFNGKHVPDHWPLGGHAALPLLLLRFGLAVFAVRVLKQRMQKNATHVAECQWTAVEQLSSCKHAVNTLIIPLRNRGTACVMKGKVI